MKTDRPSSTSLLIARALLLADATPAWRSLLIGDTAALTRRLLDAAEPAAWFELALRHPLLRRFLFATEHLLLPGILLHYLVRKRALDALVHEALDAGCQQVVVLGAGLDTLAWRLPAARVSFEMDHPATQAIKRRLSRSDWSDESDRSDSPNRQTASSPRQVPYGPGPVLIAADLLHGSVAELLRAEAQFVPDQPTLYVAEGLLMYLPPARVAELFTELAALSAPGSRFAFTFMEARPDRPIGFHNQRRVIDWWLRWRAEPFHWALTRPDVETFAVQHGWKLASLSSPEELRRLFLTPAGLGTAPLATGESVAMAYLRER